MNRTFPLHTLLIVLIGGVLYANTLTAAFVFDDYHSIVENVVLRNLGNVPSIWKTHTTRFLPYLSFALNYRVGRLDVVGYHAVNIVLHLLNALLVYVLFRALARTEKLCAYFEDRDVPLLALFTALVFLAHPVQTQSVTYVVQRINLIAAFFFLAAVTLYLASVRMGRRVLLAPALFCTVAAMLSKENSFPIPFVLMACEALLLGGRKREKAGRLIPFFLCLPVIPVALFINLPYRGCSSILAQTQSLTGFQYFLTQTHVFWTYLRLLFFPLVQNADYDYSVVQGLEPLAVMTVVLLAVLTGALWKFARRYRLEVFCLCWMALTLVVESSFIPIEDVIQEHRLYLPMFGFSALLVVGLERILSRKRLLTAMLVLIVGVLAYLTVTRNMTWQNNMTFWEDVIHKSPQKTRGYVGLANAYVRWGMLAQSDQTYRQAFALNPDDPAVLNGMGVVLILENRYEEALKVLGRAVVLDPTAVNPYINIGYIYKMQGNWKQAQGAFQKALQLDGLNVQALGHLADVLEKEGDVPEAGRIRARLRALDPRHPSYHNGIDGPHRRRHP